jgi:hypothetical protein
MTLIPRRYSVRRRRAVHAAIDAYVEWRDQCVAVRNAFAAWTGAAVADAGRAFESYRSALDREERAADAYAALMKRLGPLIEPDPPHELADAASWYAAWTW